MGSIDFDPTSDPVQQVLVNATSVPKIEVNPLQEHWHGNVWVSPKGAVRDCRVWLNKTINEYRGGYINSFIYFCSASELLRASPVLGIIQSASRSNELNSYEQRLLDSSLYLLQRGIYLSTVLQSIKR